MAASRSRARRRLASEEGRLNGGTVSKAFKDEVELNSTARSGTHAACKPLAAHIVTPAPRAGAPTRAWGSSHGQSSNGRWHRERALPLSSRHQLGLDGRCYSQIQDR